MVRLLVTADPCLFNGEKRENLLIGWVLVGFESCHCFRYSPSHPSPGIPIRCPSKDAVNMLCRKCLEIPKRETNVSTKGMWICDIYDYL